MKHFNFQTQKTVESAEIRKLNEFKYNLMHFLCLSKCKILLYVCIISFICPFLEANVCFQQNNTIHSEL